MTSRLLGLLLIASAFLGLGGCVYDPAYYHRAGVVYDDDEGGTYAEPYYDSYYAGPYYYNPWYYGYGWGYPSIGLGFSYYGGHRGHYHGGHHSYHHSGSNTYQHH